VERLFDRDRNAVEGPRSRPVAPAGPGEALVGLGGLPPCLVEARHDHGVQPRIDLFDAGDVGGDGI